MGDMAIDPYKQAISSLTGQEDIWATPNGDLEMWVAQHMARNVIAVQDTVILQLSVNVTVAKMVIGTCNKQSGHSDQMKKKHIVKKASETDLDNEDSSDEEFVT